MFDHPVWEVDSLGEIKTICFEGGRDYHPVLNIYYYILTGSITFISPPGMWDAGALGARSLEVGTGGCATHP